MTSTELYILTQINELRDALQRMEDKLDRVNDQA